MHPRSEDEVLRVFAKWGLDAVIVGTVQPEPRLCIRHHGELVADIPNTSLTDEAPLYHRPVGTWKAPVPADPPEEILATLAEDRDYTADLKKLLASANVCSKRWVHEQYDTMVQTNTVIGPGGEAGVMRIKGTARPDAAKGPVGEIGLAMALDGNGRWAYLDPKLGAMHAVAECARKVAMTGATPVAATNCLNFGNPEKPEIMAQLSAAIDGIAEACTALGTPITGGNVSLYNETRGEGIYPTPVLGIVGILDDVTKAVPADFRAEGDAIVLLWPIPRGEEPAPSLEVPVDNRNLHWQVPIREVLPEDPIVVPEDVTETEASAAVKLASFGSSEYAKVVLGNLWGNPPALDLEAEADLHKLLAALAERELLRSARDISDGGIAVALAQAAFPLGIGATVEQDQSLMAHPLFGLFAEPASTVLVTTHPSNVATIERLAAKHRGLASQALGLGSGSYPSRRGNRMIRRLYQGVNDIAGATELGAPGPNSGIWDSSVSRCRDPKEDPKLREECGVVAIHGHPEAARQAYLGLYALQHRGQESAGIATADGLHLANIKGMGLVSEIFTDDILAKLPGQMAIGHTRYSTTGDSALLNAQPIRVDSVKGLIAIAHNGNLVNLGNLRSRLERDGAYFQTTSDSEIIVQLIAHSHAGTLVDAIADSLRQVEGAFSIVMMTRDRIFAARDPRGFRPLSMGRMKNPDGPDTIVFASETCAFDLLRAEYIRDVLPGELVMVTDDGVTSRQYATGFPQSSCIFEHVYFARPDSRIFGRWVQ